MLLTATALEREARRVTSAALSVPELCLALDAVLRRHVPYGVAAWATHDPATGLTTSCTLSGLPRDDAREAGIFRHEFDPDEPATYLSLISGGQVVARLADVTDGDLSRASRWRDVLGAFGVTDELRAILWSADQPWGSVSLYRMDTRFSPEEAAIVAVLAPIVADALRVALLRTAAERPMALDDPPGIVGVTPEGDVRPLTRPAERWLAVGGEELRTSARVIATALRVRADWDGATSRVAGDGRVLTLHAAHAVTPDGDVAVIVEASRPAEVGAMLVDAFGLTRRQREVLGHLLLGRSMARIAGELGISEHTANDHRKAIYARIGVSSRSELAALLQAEVYDPFVHAGAAPSPYGGFLEMGDRP